MKFTTFIAKSDDSNTQKIGALKKDGQTVTDLQGLYLYKNGGPSPWFIDMLSFLDNFKEALPLAEELLEGSVEACDVSLDEIRILAPVPRPRSIRDFSVYEQHMINCGRSFAKMRGIDTTKADPESFKPDKNWYQLPIYYKGNPASVGGIGTEIHYPDGETFRDYECELGFYIGKQGKDIKKENALEYIAGFTIFNDFTARNLQGEEMNGYVTFGPAKGKDFDTGNVMGPFLVTKDEFDHTNAEMIITINGVESARGNSGTYYHSIESILERVSKSETVYPGDFIGMGTVGWGCGLEHYKPVLPGDVIELEIEGIGKLTNKIAK